MQQDLRSNDPDRILRYCQSLNHTSVHSTVMLMTGPTIRLIADLSCCEPLDQAVLD